MISSLLFRRLVLPVIAVVVVACAMIGIYAGVRKAALGAGERELHGTAWAAGGVGIVAAGAIAIITVLYARAQARAIAESFERLLPVKERGISSARTIETAIAATADSVAHLIDRAAKDQGQLLTIISSMTEGLVALDQQQRILLANRAAEQLLGIKMPGAQGQPIWEHVAVEGVTQAAAQVMLTGRPRSFTCGPHNGLHLDIIVSRLPAAGGLVIMAHDVTEATRYQRLREEFVANVSHELRTPLAVIKGYVETLRDGAMEDRARAQQYLSTVAEHAEQLTRLVNDVLDLSQLENRAVAVAKDPVDVGEMLRRVAQSLEPAAQQKRQTLKVELPQDLPTIKGSVEDLSRAVSNLVENAIKYTRESGTIHVSAQREPDAVLITVEDNGIGISEDDLPRIFERFYRSDRSRSREMGGTGLGLSIVKHIIQSHGGTIEVTSRLGAGSKFTVRLPVS